VRRDSLILSPRDRDSGVTDVVDNVVAYRAALDPDDGNAGNARRPNVLVRLFPALRGMMSFPELVVLLPNSCNGESVER
jgi:hypothetical protein